MNHVGNMLLPMYNPTTNTADSHVRAMSTFT